MLAFDHAVLNVMGEMEAMAALYRRLGFTLTPRGYHTLGSINHLAVFGDCYLELLGYAPGEEQWAYPAGLTGLALRTPDAPALHAAAGPAGVPVEPCRAFSRPVTLDGQEHDASFRTFQIDRTATSNGRLFFCEHQTPELIWRPDDQSHANGAVGIAAAWIACTDPEAVAGLIARMPGVSRRGPCDLEAGTTALCFRRPGELAAEITPDPLPGLGEGHMRMAALDIACTDPAAVAALLRAQDIPYTLSGETVQLAADTAGGMVLRFVPAR